MLGYDAWRDCVGDCDCGDMYGVSCDALTWSNMDVKLFGIDTSRAEGWQREGVLQSDDDAVARLSHELGLVLRGDHRR